MSVRVLDNNCGDLGLDIPDSSVREANVESVIVGR